jgi:hypothetical protein
MTEGTRSDRLQVGGAAHSRTIENRMAAENIASASRFFLI